MTFFCIAAELSYVAAVSKLIIRGPAKIRESLPTGSKKLCEVAQIFAM